MCQNTTKLAIQLGKVKGNHCVRIICTSSALTEMKRAQCGDLTSRANDKCIFLSKVVLVLAFVLNSQRKRFLIPFESRLIVLLALRPLWLKYNAWTQSLHTRREVTSSSLVYYVCCRVLQLFNEKVDQLSFKWTEKHTCHLHEEVRSPHWPRFISVNTLLAQIMRPHNYSPWLYLAK